MLTGYEIRFDRGYGGYYSLPKQIGSVSPEVLLQVADFNITRAKQLNTITALPFQQIAASAYIEAMLVTEDPEHTNLDEILGCLDLAESVFLSVAAGKFSLLERGIIHPDHQCDWHRAELQCDFMNVYRDIACGDVTLHTRNEILKKLKTRLGDIQILTQTRRLENEVHGLAYELVVLQDIWEKYRGEGDSIAFPSTVRGGNGEINPRDTHDIDLAHQENGVWYFDPRGLEVKGGEGHLPENLERYNCPIACVSRSGKITIVNNDKVPTRKSA